jgi:pimeloyl-ACP methyl ester carboxylesterase
VRHALFGTYHSRLRRIAVGIIMVALATSCAPAAAPLAPWVSLGPPSVSARIRPLISTGLATPGRPVLEEGGLRIPSNPQPDRPVPVLLALHGANGSGPRLADRLAGCAERNGWLLVAPTLSYRNYMDSEQLRIDEQQHLPRLRELLASVRARLSLLPVASGEFVYGFSRGGQLAHRMALFYPDDVAGVAVVAAGTYTVPRLTSTAGRWSQPLRFPFGVADLERYAGHRFDPAAFAGKPFWIGVGAQDTVAEQVPRGWDPLLGRTRLERAAHFAEELRGLGADVSLNVFSDTAHDETALMRERACDYLTSLTPVRAR